MSRYVFDRHELVRDWMLGATAAEDVCALAGDFVGFRTEDVLADLEYSCRRMELYDPSVVDTLRSISKRGIKVVLATDNMDTFRRWTVPALQLDTVFDDVLTSGSSGVLKSDLADGKSLIFTPWLTDRGVMPSQAILIDDHCAPAAEAIGMAVRLLDDPSKLVSTLVPSATARQKNDAVHDTAGESLADPMCRPVFQVPRVGSLQCASRFGWLIASMRGRGRRGSARRGDDVGDRAPRSAPPSLDTAPRQGFGACQDDGTNSRPELAGLLYIDQLLIVAWCGSREPR